MKAALYACVVSALLWSGCASQQQQASTGGRNWGSSQQQASSGGRSHASSQQQQQRKPAAAPAAAPASAPAPKVEAKAASNEGTLKTDLVNITKRAPAAVSLGETYAYDINYVANENLDSLVITDQLGEGLTYVRSEPAATVSGQNLSWRLRDLPRGGSGTAKIWVKADREGTVNNCATVVAIPQVCVATLVGSAKIAIEKSGPETALLGSDVTYNIVVKNSGTMTAKDVVVTDLIPEGLTHANGQRTVSFNIGELGAGQSKTIPVTLKAATKGKHCNVAEVATSNAGKATNDACTVVLAPGLKIAKTGTKEQILGRNADYQIVVSNTGETTLTGVTVTDTAPAATTIVAADGARISGSSATWAIGDLRAGEKRTLNVKLTSKTAGTHCNGVSVATTQGLSDRAEACTLWKGIAAVLLEAVDEPDPIQVGETTTYTIKVTNQGFADINNVQIVTEFDEELTPVSAAQGSISGQRVSFPKVVRIGAKQMVTYTVTVKGAKVGDARNKITLTSDELKTPVVEEESTTVY